MRVDIWTINYNFSDLSLTFILSKCESVLTLELAEADMEFTELDRNALYDIWMSQKAKMHITQMEMAKRLGLSLHEFSGLLRGNSPLTLGFVKQLCEQLHVRPGQVIPSLTERDLSASGTVYLQNRVTVDGDISNVFIDGNQVVIEYVHQVS
ncbi:transcriptional regulator [Vibrio alginolyticus]|nr:transcriptional regulator [Vibrio alginolyticus]